MADTGSENLWPVAVEEERALLGASVFSADIARALAIECDESDFGLSVHADIFHAIRGIVPAPVDFLEIAEQLKNVGKLESVGGVAYIASLTDLVVAARPFSRRLAILREYRQRRALIAKLDAAIHQLARGYVAVDAVIADLRSALETSA